MMHKFYSEPVAALDLRLTKSEASLFGMESNPLDVDVKMDEEEPVTKEENAIHVNEVQVSQLPPLSPISPMPLPQQPTTEVAEHEEDIDPSRVVVESPGDIQHVTLHIARSPPRCGLTASSTSVAAGPELR